MCKGGHHPIRRSGTINRAVSPSRRYPLRESKENQRGEKKRKEKKKRTDVGRFTPKVLSSAPTLFSRRIVFSLARRNSPKKTSRSLNTQ